MSPPNGVNRVGSSGSVKNDSSSGEREAYLKASEFFFDPAISDFQKQWENNRDFRLPYFQHSQLVSLIDLFTRYMNGDSNVQEKTKVQEKFKGALQAWTASPDFYSDTLNSVVLQNMYRILGSFRVDENVQRAAELRKILQLFTQEKQPEGNAKTGDAGISQGWRLNTYTLSTHFADDSFRRLPHYYTLKIIPEEGFGQNQSSDFAISGGVESSYKDFGFFLDGYYNDAKPLGALNSASPTLGDPKYSAQFGQAGVRAGMVEYNNQLFAGQRFEGLSIGLFGRKRVGIGLGVSWCKGVNGDSSSKLCTDSGLQISTINDSDFLTIGDGPFELNFRLLPATTYLNLGHNGLPESNRLPIEYGMAYHLTPPHTGGKTNNPDELLKANEKVTDAQVAMSALSLFTDAIRYNAAHKTEAGYQSQRLIALGTDRADAQYGLLNAGSFVNGTLNGFGQGSTAYRMQREFRYGSKEQRWGLGAVLGAELAVNLIGFAATPGLPSESDYLAGKTDGITNLQARSFRLNLPLIASRDAFIALGAVGAFGDVNKAIKEEGSHFSRYLGSHAALGVAGLVLMLTSGDGSGTGVLGGSIFGNKAPNTIMIEVPGSQFDYPAQNGQMYRLELGAMALGYGLNGAIDLMLQKYKYNDLKAKCADAENKAVCQGGSEKPKESKSGPDVHIGVNTDGHSKVNAAVYGTF